MYVCRTSTCIVHYEMEIAILLGQSESLGYAIDFLNGIII